MEQAQQTETSVQICQSINRDMQCGLLSVGQVLDEAYTSGVEVRISLRRVLAVWSDEGRLRQLHRRLRRIAAREAFTQLEAVFGHEYATTALRDSSDGFRAAVSEGAPDTGVEGPNDESVYLRLVGAYAAPRSAAISEWGRLAASLDQEHPGQTTLNLTQIGAQIERLRELRAQREAERDRRRWEEEAEAAAARELRNVIADLHSATRGAYERGVSVGSIRSTLLACGVQIRGRGFVLGTLGRELGGEFTGTVGSIREATRRVRELNGSVPPPDLALHVPVIDEPTGVTVNIDMNGISRWVAQQAEAAALAALAPTQLTPADQIDTETFVAGIAHYDFAAQPPRIGLPIMLIPEPNNRHDKEAVMVVLANGKQVGHIPRSCELKASIFQHAKRADLEGRIIDSGTHSDGKNYVKIRVVGVGKIDGVHVAPEAAPEAPKKANDRKMTL